MRAAAAAARRWGRGTEAAERRRESRGRSSAVSAMAVKGGSRESAERSMMRREAKRAV